MDFKVVLFVLFIMEAMGGDSIPQVTNFFPEVDSDLRRITWGHAINSKALLDDAIEKDLYMMLEADVSKGHLKNETEPSKLIPIMAHPPHKTSDISLEMWIDKVVEANEMGKKMGVKLDFKDLDIVITSLEILMKKSTLLRFPLWLNADILKGPGGENKTPVDADIFLSLCTEFFPEATLSLGWTTEFVPGADQKYTLEMMDEMVDTLEKNNVNQPVTFPVRAAFVGSSIDALESLYLDKPNSSFTVWTSATDEVNVKELAKVQTGFESDSLLFDLPDEMVEQVIEEGRVVQIPSRSNSYTNNIIVFVVGLILSFFGAQYFIK